MKKILTSALIIATIALGAQNKQKKACIKIESEENGKVTKIDTCVTANTEEELRQKLEALHLGIGDMPPIPPVPPVPPIPGIEIVIDSLPGEGKEMTYTKVIVIDDGEDNGKEGRKNGSKKKMKVVSSSAGGNGEAEVIVMDGEGNIITSDKKGSDKVVVKHLKPGEKPDAEMEKLMKENGFDYNYTTGDGKGSASKIVIRNHENKNGKESGDVKVFVFSKVEVKDLTEAEKKNLPADATKAIKSGKTFDNLNIAPNPTDDACNITYKSVSKEPLQIKVYNSEGKTVLTETETGMGEQVNKSLSLKGLGQGVYFVHLTQGKASEVRKVIVK